MKTAMPIVNAVSVLTYYQFGDHYWLETCVGANNYEEFAQTPQALAFEGRNYGRSGWNSDTGRVYYTTRKVFATRD